MAETHTQDLETFRVETLEALREHGEWLKTLAERVVGEPVRAVYMHGSLLYPEEFTERSDVDVAVVFENERGVWEAGRDKYDPVELWSRMLSREFPPVNGSALDVCAFGPHGTPHGERIA